MRLCLLGDPVAHSRSPAIHRAALAACGITGSYEALTVDAAGFADAIADLRRGVFDGANVTMPHKGAAHDACDDLAGEAERAGAVNTLAMRRGRLTGWNTDVLGLRRLLADLPDGPLLILGAGGAARAALAATDRMARVAAREPQRGAAAADRFGRAVHPWGAPWPGAVVVNATPLGMLGEPLPPGVLDGAVALVDLAYGSEGTPAVRQARERGIPVVDGIAVLVAQAADAFEIWTGMAAPLEAMGVAARQFAQGG